MPPLDLKNLDDIIALGVLHERAQYSHPLACYKPGKTRYGTAADERLLELGFIERCEPDHDTWSGALVTEAGWAMIAAEPMPLMAFKIIDISPR